MSWKKIGEREYQRSCRHCGGTGKEGFDFRGRRCQCPWDGCDDVDHPSNTVNHPDLKHKGIWNKIVRCDACGNFWVVYFEALDDSWDVPRPECLGIEIPADDWRPNS